MWLTGNRVSGNWAHPDEKSTIFELKAYVENIFTRMGISQSEMVVTQISDDLFSAALQITTRGGKLLGHVGIVTRKLLKKADIEADVFYAELLWDNMLRLAMRNKVTYTELPKYQSVKRDLALLVDNAVTFADIERIAHAADRKLLREVSLFDVYEGDKLPAGKKSYAVSFILQDDDKTLTDKQIEVVMKRLIAAFEQQVGAQLR